jgi:small subunit ribosomal protein S1
MTGEGKAPGIPDINWEDDDQDFGKTQRAEDEDADFVSLLDQDDARGGPQSFMIGEKVVGVISRVPATGEIMVDLGGKSSGIIERAELMDDAGKVALKVGDPVEAFVVSKRGGEILLSYRLTASMKSMEDLERAKQQKLAIRGKVVSAGKGGFEISVLGKTAFCPISQMDTRFVENGAEHVGKEYEFLVERIESGGRNIVLSRAALLKRQGEERLEQLLKTLEPEQVLSGTVTEIRDFGAFVDIGGVEGLVHISALSHARVAKASDVVTRGDQVRVKVLKIERDERGRPKIALSMKAASQDPWETIAEHVQRGKTYTGRVVSLQPFGAFVEIKPGIEGLIHVSEMSWTKRVHHPSDVVKLDDTVTVTVKDVDSEKKRIGLTMKQVEDDPWFGATSKLPAGKVVTAPVERLKPFGAIVTLGDGLSGLLPLGVIKRKFGEAYRQPCTPGKELEVKIQNIDPDARKILLTLVGVDEEAADQKDYLEYLEDQKKAEVAASAKADKPEGATGSFGALLKQKLERR